MGIKGLLARFPRSESQICEDLRLGRLKSILYHLRFMNLEVKSLVRL